MTQEQPIPPQPTQEIVPMHGPTAAPAGSGAFAEAARVPQMAEAVVPVIPGPEVAPPEEVRRRGIAGFLGRIAAPVQNAYAKLGAGTTMAAERVAGTGDNKTRNIASRFVDGQIAGVAAAVLGTKLAGADVSHIASMFGHNAGQGHVADALSQHASPSSTPTPTETLTHTPSPVPSPGHMPSPAETATHTSTPNATTASHTQAGNTGAAHHAATHVPAKANTAPLPADVELEKVKLGEGPSQYFNRMFDDMGVPKDPKVRSALIDHIRHDHHVLAVARDNGDGYNANGPDQAATLGFRHLNLSDATKDAIQKSYDDAVRHVPHGNDSSAAHHAASAQAGGSATHQKVVPMQADLPAGYGAKQIDAHHLLITLPQNIVAPDGTHNFTITTPNAALIDGEWRMGAVARNQLDVALHNHGLDAVFHNDKQGNITSVDVQTYGTGDRIDLQLPSGYKGSIRDNVLNIVPAGSEKGINIVLPDNAINPKTGAYSASAQHAITTAMRKHDYNVTFSQNGHVVHVAAKAHTASATPTPTRTATPAPTPTQTLPALLGSNPLGERIQTAAGTKGDHDNGSATAAIGVASVATALAAGGYICDD